MEEEPDAAHTMARATCDGAFNPRVSRWGPGGSSVCSRTRRRRRRTESVPLARGRYGGDRHHGLRDA
jgi:hypothetical protein